jgi:predicted nucleic acid-binding protein
MAIVIVLDASVLIAYLDGNDEHHAEAERLLAQEVDEDFGANSLTLAEVLVAPARDDRLDRARTALRDLEVDELPFPVDAALKHAQLRVETGLKMPDRCVLLAAEPLHARVATFDNRLRNAATRRKLETLGR